MHNKLKLSFATLIALGITASFTGCGGGGSGGSISNITDSGTTGNSILTGNKTITGTSYGFNPNFSINWNSQELYDQLNITNVSLQVEGLNNPISLNYSSSFYITEAERTSGVKNDISFNVNGLIPSSTINRNANLLITYNLNGVGTKTLSIPYVLEGSVMNYDFTLDTGLSTSETEYLNYTEGENIFLTLKLTDTSGDVPIPMSNKDIKVEVLTDNIVKTIGLNSNKTQISVNNKIVAYGSEILNNDIIGKTNNDGYINININNLAENISDNEKDIYIKVSYIENGSNLKEKIFKFKQNGKLIAPDAPVELNLTNTDPDISQQGGEKSISGQLMVDGKYGNNYNINYLILNSTTVDSLDINDATNIPIISNESGTLPVKSDGSFNLKIHFKQNVTNEPQKVDVVLFAGNKKEVVSFTQSEVVTETLPFTFGTLNDTFNINKPSQIVTIQGRLNDKGTTSNAPDGTKVYYLIDTTDGITRVQDSTGWNTNNKGYVETTNGIFSIPVELGTNDTGVNRKFKFTLYPEGSVSTDTYKDVTITQSSSVADAVTYAYLGINSGDTYSANTVAQTITFSGQLVNADTNTPVENVPFSYVIDNMAGITSITPQNSGKTDTSGVFKIDVQIDGTQVTRQLKLFFNGNSTPLVLNIAVADNGTNTITYNYSGITDGDTFDIPAKAQTYTISGKLINNDTNVGIANNSFTTQIDSTDGVTSVTSQNGGKTDANGQFAVDVNLDGTEVNRQLKIFFDGNSAPLTVNLNVSSLFNKSLYNFIGIKDGDTYTGVASTAQTINVSGKIENANDGTPATGNIKYTIDSDAGLDATQATSGTVTIDTDGTFIVPVKIDSTATGITRIVKLFVDGTSVDDGINVSIVIP